MSARVLCVLCCACALALRAAAAAPAPDSPFGAYTLLYTADHEVTKLGVIFGENIKLEDKTVFFIESDTDERGERVDYGLYALNHDVKTKLLDNARDIAVVDLATAYFAAREGIYVYNKEKNSAQKYGSVSEEAISLAVENGTGAIYYLNRRHQLYKVTENGNKSSLVDAVKDAEEVVVDYSGHLYYYTADKQFYVYDGHDVRKIEDIPDRMKKVWFLRTPMVVGFVEYGLVYGDDQLYVIRGANASARAMGRLSVRAASADLGVVLYCAKDKEIYEFNLLEEVIIAKIVEDVLEFVSWALREYAQQVQDSFDSEGYSPVTFLYAFKMLF